MLRKRKTIETPEETLARRVEELEDALFFKNTIYDEEIDYFREKLHEIFVIVEKHNIILSMKNNRNASYKMSKASAMVQTTIEKVVSITRHLNLHKCLYVFLACLDIPTLLLGINTIKDDVFGTNTKGDDCRVGNNFYFLYEHTQFKTYVGEEMLEIYNQMAGCEKLTMIELKNIINEIPKKIDRILKVSDVDE